MNQEFIVPQIDRYRVRDLNGIETPRLLFYQWAIDANREKLKVICGGFENLRLMFKTCPASAILESYRCEGMNAVKTACLSEARAVAAHSSLADIMIAFPCFGTAVDRFIAMRKEFPDRRFSLVVPNLACAQGLSAKADTDIPVYLDIDPGMKRTGVAFGRQAVELADAIASLPHLSVCGLHVYDGNIHHPNPHAIRAYSDRLMAKIDETVSALQDKYAISEVVTSSSISMESNLEAYRAGQYPWHMTVSPGTAVLWDSNYNDILPGEFSYAAAVATRILDVRRHRDGHFLTTDCGIKLGASVDAGPLHVLGFRGYRPFGKSERFGMLTRLGFDRATGEPVGDSLEEMAGRVVLVFPQHVCTTVSQYAFGLLVRDGKVGERISIDGRDG